MLLSSKWRWARSLYDDLFRIVVVLTNAHVTDLPLRAEEDDKFNHVRNRYAHIAEEGNRKRSATVQLYRERRRIRLNHQFRRDQFGSEQDSYM